MCNAIVPQIWHWHFQATFLLPDYVTVSELCVDNFEVERSTHESVHLDKSENCWFSNDYYSNATIPVVESPPEPAAKSQGGSEPAKTRILRQVLNRDKTPRVWWSSDYFETNYFEALGACGEHLILISLLWETFNRPKNRGNFVLEPARLLRACKPGLRACLILRPGLRRCV